MFSQEKCCSHNKPSDQAVKRTRSIYGTVQVGGTASLGLPPASIHKQRVILQQYQFPKRLYVHFMDWNANAAVCDIRERSTTCDRLENCNAPKKPSHKVSAVCKVFRPFCPCISMLKYENRPQPWKISGHLASCYVFLVWVSFLDWY